MATKYNNESAGSTDAWAKKQIAREEEYQKENPVYCNEDYEECQKEFGQPKGWMMQTKYEGKKI